MLTSRFWGSLKKPDDVGWNRIEYREALCLAEADERESEKDALLTAIIQMQDNCSFQLARQLCELFEVDYFQQGKGAANAFAYQIMNQFIASANYSCPS